jgi:hypothetical protein
MRALLVLILAFSFLSLRALPHNGKQEKPKKSESVSAEVSAVLAAEKARADAVLRGDLMSLNRLIADDYFVTTSFGTLGNKTKELAFYRNATCKTPTWQPYDVVIRLFANTAVITERAAFKDVLEGQTRDIQMRLTHVWIKRDGRWQVVVRHGTKMTVLLPESASAPQVLTFEDEPSRAGDADIVQKEKELRNAHLKGDAAALDRLDAEDFIAINPEGVVRDRVWVLTAYRSGNNKDEAIDNSDVKIHSYGNIAVVTLRSDIQRHLDGKDLSGAFRITRVWARRNGEWKIVVTQSTRIPVGAGGLPTS